MTELQSRACHRHADRETLTVCARCGAPICLECQRIASHGFHCPTCPAEQAPEVTAWARPSHVPSESWRRSVPMATTLWLIGANVAVWLLIGLSGGASSGLMRRLALEPTSRCTHGRFWIPVIRDPDTCERIPGTSWIRGLDDGAVWQLLTSAFTHVSLTHLLNNMIVLLAVGPLVESRLGRQRYLGLYALSALAASVSVFWLTRDETTLGASGALFGLIGASLVLSLRLGDRVAFVLLRLALAVWLAVSGGAAVSWQGHLGGLAGGVAAAVATVYVPRRHRGAAWTVIAVGLLLAVWVRAGGIG